MLHVFSSWNIASSDSHVWKTLYTNTSNTLSKINNHVHGELINDKCTQQGSLDWKNIFKKAYEGKQKHPKFIFLRNHSTLYALHLFWLQLFHGRNFLHLLEASASIVMQLFGSMTWETTKHLDWNVNITKSTQYLLDRYLEFNFNNHERFPIYLVILWCLECDFVYLFCFGRLLST